MTGKNRNRIILLGVIAVLIGLFFALDLQQYLTLEYLKQSRTNLQTYYHENPGAMLGGYFLAYILVVALNLPGAAIMTLAGGALFGFLPALVVVSFASTIGATLACFVSRYLFHDFVQNRFADKLAWINEGIRREGSFYLFTLRLVPIFPFFMINLVFGLTKMSMRTFYWVSQVGMLPGTAVYVNAGVQLGKLDSLSGILSPQLLLSFALLGIFPLIAKKTVGWYRARRG